MTAAASHNGGLTQVNFNFVQGAADFAYINCLKTATDWGPGSGSAPVTPDILDTLGYPTTIVSSGVSTVFFIPSQLERPGNYVITWSGNGTIAFTGTILPTATFTGSVSNGVLAAGAPTGGTIQKGMPLSVGGIIGDQISGTAGGAGNYSVIGGSNAGSQSITVTGGSLVSSGGAGRFVCAPTGHQMTIGITALGSPRISNLQVFHVDDEALLNAGEIFGVKFKQRIAEAKFGVLRFLNWTRGNNTHVTTWATRKTPGYVFYHGTEKRAANYCGSVSYGGLGNTALSVSASPSWTSLADKTTVTILFGASVGSAVPGTATITNANANVTWNAHGLSVNNRFVFDPSSSIANFPTNITILQKYWIVAVPDANTIQFSATQGGTAITPNSTPVGTVTVNPVLTLNVSGSGDVDVLSHQSQPLSTRTNSYPLANRLATLVYDQVMNCWIKIGGDTAFGSRGIDNGVPPEDCLRLCAETGTHPYFVAPAYAMTPATDYMPSLAVMCRDGAPSWMIPRFEGPNELWNGGTGFAFDTNYANAVAVAYGWGADFHNWMGRAMSTLGQDVAAVYGVAMADVKTQTKYQVLCGVQTGLASTLPGTTGSDPRLSSAKYLIQTPQSGYLASAASNWVTHACVALYITPSAETNSTTMTTLAAAFAGKTFTASIAGGVLTVSAIKASNSAAFSVGDTIFDSAVFACNLLPAGITIVSFGTATGGTGTYNLSANAAGITMSSRTMSAAADLTAPKTYINTLSSGSGPTNPNVLTNYINWATWAARFSAKLSGYEGGYATNLDSGGNSLRDMLRIAGKQQPDLVQLFLKNLRNFASQGGEFPADFQFTGTVNTLGYAQDGFSILDDLYQSPNPPQFEANRLFSNRKRRILW
jgi:hypothetical protein